MGNTGIAVRSGRAGRPTANHKFRGPCRTHLFQHHDCLGEGCLGRLPDMFVLYVYICTQTLMVSDEMRVVPALPYDPGGQGDPLHAEVPAERVSRPSTTTPTMFHPASSGNATILFCSAFATLVSNLISLSLQNFLIASLENSLSPVNPFMLPTLF